MPRFQIFPIDQSSSPIELVAPEAAGVLPLLQRLTCRDADVMRDGEYCFSVQLDENGLWCIYQRQPVEDVSVPPLAG
jgi:hypothetical protein